MLKLLVFLPLLGAVLSGFFSRYIGKKGSMIIPTGLCAVSLILSIILLYNAILGEHYVIHIV